MEIFVFAAILGIFKGTIYALMAFGMVACYRINRVVNLAQAGTAVFAATVYWWMTSLWGAPVVVALVAGIMAGVVVGALLGTANLRMAAWPRGLVMIFTLAITLLLFSASERLLPDTIVSPPSPFGEGGITLSLTFVSAHQIGTLATCLAVAALAAWVLRRTRTGIYVRAIYDDPDGSATLGVPLNLFVVGVWAVAGALAGLAGILVSRMTLLDSVLLLFVTIWALAAGILGGLTSFGAALAGGILLGLAQGVLGGVFGGQLGPGLENLAAVMVMAAGVLYAGIKHRDLAQIQT